MFERMTEKEAREHLLKMTEEYYQAYHKTREGSSRIHYAGRVYDEKEMRALVDSSLDFWLTSGRFTAAFEKRLGEILKVKFCSLVNSGSSANLLAFMALTSPLLQDRQVKRGDEIITVAAGFPTTVTPMLQYGAVPVFIDIEIPQYNLDISQLEGALSPRTKGIMVAHTLGNPFDLEKVKSFCEDKSLWLIEDNCDSLGSQYRMEGKQVLTGTVGDIGTSSFYPPHHITMGEGGAVYTRNPLLHKIIRSMRDWGRDCICESGQDNMCGHRFDRQYGSLPMGYDHKYVYSHFGYNLKATDMQASIGIAQLEKLPEFTEKRRKNFARLASVLKPAEEAGWLTLPQALPGAAPSWFGYLITCEKGISRNEMTRTLEEKGIQTRTLFAGNITRHPCFETLEEGEYRVPFELVNTDRVMNDSFWIGVYPGLTETQLDYMGSEILREARRQVGD